jgi:hypothetical protein
MYAQQRPREVLSAVNDAFGKKSFLENVFRKIGAKSADIELNLAQRIVIRETRSVGVGTWTCLKPLKVMTLDHFVVVLILVRSLLDHGEI